MNLPEDGYINGRNMWEVYGVYKIFSYTYLHLFVLLSYLGKAYLKSSLSEFYNAVDRRVNIYRHCFNNTLQYSMNLHENY